MMRIIVVQKFLYLDKYYKFWCEEYNKRKHSDYITNRSFKKRDNIALQKLNFFLGIILK